MWIFSFVANLIGWAILTFSDYLDEATSGGGYMMSVIFGVPALVAVAYIIRNLVQRKEGADTIKECLKNAGKWLLVSGGFAVVIIYLLDKEWWIVKQATGGWEHFLNGIEYYLFALFLVGGVLAVIIFWNILRWMYGIMKSVLSKR